MRFKVARSLPAQTAFWTDAAKNRAYVGGIGAGKTYAGAIEILRMPPQSRGMVIAPTYPMLKDASQRTFFDVASDAVKQHNKQEQYTILRNGTTVLWRSADNPIRLRGPNLGWIWGDEWAYASDEAHKVALGRLRLAPGRLWATTTPAGMNWFYKRVTAPRSNFGLHFSATADNTHLLPDYVTSLQDYYADDPEFAAQELAGTFVDLANSRRFPGLLVAALTREGPGLRDELTTVFEAAHFGGRYVIGADPAEGIRGGDDSAAAVIDVDTRNVVAYLAAELEPVDAFPMALAALSRRYNNAPVMVEQNAMGRTVIKRLAVHGPEVPRLSGPGEGPGWLQTPTTKAQMWATAYRSLVSSKQLGRQPLRGELLVNQIRSVERTTLAGEGKGKRTKVDDLAVAWALAECGATALEGGSFVALDSHLAVRVHPVMDLDGW